MPKRISEGLEDRRKRRRIIVETSSESDEAPCTPQEAQPNNADTEPKDDLHDLTVVPSVEDTVASEAYPELDSELLGALGEEIDSDPAFGEKIHHSLARRWEPILLKGLIKEKQDKLFKEYLIPENCSLLKAPKLNSEVVAAISESARHRDKRKETNQQQLGVGIAAINKGLTLLLTAEDKLEPIRMISDGCRILSDLHYQETQSRISLVNYSLAKPFLNIVQDSQRDETLYGTKLGEKIKASKTIEKQGLSIKKFIKQKTVLGSQAATIQRNQSQVSHPSPYQGNWAGPSRFQQNRGGQRGPRRLGAHTNRRQPVQQTSSTTLIGKPRTPVSRP